MWFSRKKKKAKTRSKRVEPRFEGAKRSSGDLRVSAADRTARVTAPNSRKAKNSKSGAARRAKTQKRKGRRSQPSLWWRATRFGTYWTCVGCLWGAIGLVILFGYFAAKMPHSSEWAVPDRAPNVQILDLDGKLLANRGATGGQAISLGEMSPHIPQAVIAIEDRRFRHHLGIDPIGLARAMVSNVMAGRVVQGGSTLSQQLAKNLFLKPERTVERKIQEMVLALWLERKYSKDEILEMYLNRVYFGSGATGVEAASLRYFQKPAKDVTLAQAALLAGLLKAPSKLSPARDPKAADARAKLVLSAMRRDGVITPEQHASAKSVTAQRARKYWSGAQHYVADWVMDRLPELIGEVRSDIIVEASIDGDLLVQAERVIDGTLKVYGQEKDVRQGALVSLDGTGAVRALVGGRDYTTSQFNRAVEAKRQPGSAFKSFVWLAALEQGATARSVRQDAPVRIGKWAPKNYDNTFRGPVTLDYALAKSLNTIAAQLVMEAGPKTVANTAKRLGIETKLNANASIALGTSEVSLLELTSAYTPFANGGFEVKPFVITTIRTEGGRVLYRHPGHSGAKVLRDRELAQMNTMLRGVVLGGTGRNAALEGWQVAGKTGTSQNFRDALFVGYTSNLTTGIWFGNDDGKPTKKVTGGSLPASAWRDFMQFAHTGVPVDALPGQARLPETVAVVPRPRPERYFGSETRNGLARVEPQRDVLPMSDAAKPNAIVPSVPISNGNVGGAAQQPSSPRAIRDLLFGS